ncbi:lipopolysaccharide biosynthesis protein [Kocuria flava]|uniref:lipopolysaccharide biosynthesis protein n=1 Tax=Kocuria flava TaxID=446860 RepID=UPI002F95BF8C
MGSESGTVSGIVKTLAGQWSKFSLQIAGTAILARILTPSDYGTVAMIMAIVGVGSLLADFGLSLASLRSPNMSGQERSNLLWANILIGSFVALMLALLASNIARFYGQSSLEPLVVFLSITFILQAAAAQFKAHVAGRGFFGRMMLVEVISQLLATSLAILLAVHGSGYWALACQQVFLFAFQLIGYVVVSRWIPSLPRKILTVKQHFVFGTKTSSSQLINYISSNVDTIAIGRTWGPASLGVYNQAFMIFKMPVQQIAAPLTHVIVPALSRSSEADFVRQAVRLQGALTYVVGGAFIVLASVAGEFVNLLLGPGWGGVAPIFTILALGGIFQVLGYVYYWVFIVKNLTGRQLIVGGAARIIMAISIVYCVQWGAMGVAWAVTGGLILNWVFLTLFVLPFAGVIRRDFVLPALRPLIILAVGFAATKVFHLLVPDRLADVMILPGSAIVWIIVLLLGAVVWKSLREDLFQLLVVMKGNTRRRAQ